MERSREELDTRLKQQIQFIVEVDKVKNIFRQTYLADANRKENDAEHSWHLALMAVLLKDYMKEEIDLAKREREEKAADRIFGLLPEDQGQEFRKLWEEFEAYKTPEAKYAHLLDNFQPLLLNDASGGKSWEEHGVHRSQVYKRNERIPETSEIIWEQMKEIIQKHIEQGHLFED